MRRSLPTAPRIAPASAIGQKLLQGRAVERGPGQPAIVIAIRVEAPALMGLALDIGLAGLALRIERVELEVEIMRSTCGYRSHSVEALEQPDSLFVLPIAKRGMRRSGVPTWPLYGGGPADLLLAVGSGVRPLGAAGDASAVSGDNVVSLSIRRPKKRGPFQFVPVMARAMVERLA
jgi:hypothetical protein